MRLTCPNCSSKYEVDDNVIPAEGREVKCSNCQHMWFQTAADAANSRRAGSTIMSGTAQSGGDQGTDTIPPRPSLSEDVVNVLREEAEREARARSENTQDTMPSEDDSGEAPEAPLEVLANDGDSEAVDDAETPDAGQDDADHAETYEAFSEPEESSDDLASAAEDDETPADQEDVAAEDDEERQSETAIEEQNENREELPSALLPDIEQINSSLHAEPDIAAERKRGGFRTGFLLSLLIIGGAVAVYAYAPEIIEAWPEGESVISDYVATIDEWRVKLHTTVAPVLGLS